MILAAIDIGSNAVRLQITRVIQDDDVTSFKKLQYIRFPLRLGSDVFVGGKIEHKKFEEFIQLMQAFKIMLDLYGVDQYYACATSAMREAMNGKELTSAVKKTCDLEINIISGDLEAELINKVIAFYLQGEEHLHIDVGGGSTELNIYRERKKVISKSFPLGTVRILRDFDQSETWNQLYQWLLINISSPHGLVAIGTGGNIRKLFELANGEKEKYISLKNLVRTQQSLKIMSNEEMIQSLQLNEDRADVIIPASEIYINIMKKAGAKKILVPDVGLKDGIIAYLYEKQSS